MSSDGYGSQNRGSEPDNHEILDGRVSLPLAQTGAPETHALIDHHIVSDDRRLADHDPHSMVNETTGTDGGTRMDLDPGEETRDRPDHACGQAKAAHPERMREPMPPESMNPRIKEQDFQNRPGGGIPLEGDPHILPGALKEVHQRRFFPREAADRRAGFRFPS